MAFSTTSYSFPQSLLSNFPTTLLATNTVSQITTPSGVVSIKGMATGTFSVTPGTVAAAGTFVTTTTITGLSVGDMLVAQIEGAQASSVALDAFYPSSANTATIVFANRDAATARARGATTIRYLWVDITS